MAVFDRFMAVFDRFMALFDRFMAIFDRFMAVFDRLWLYLTDVWLYLTDVWLQAPRYHGRALFHSPPSLPRPESTPGRHGRPFRPFLETEIRDRTQTCKTWRVSHGTRRKRPSRRRFHEGIDPRRPPQATAGCAGFRLGPLETLPPRPAELGATSRSFAREGACTRRRGSCPRPGSLETPRRRPRWERREVDTRGETPSPEGRL